MATKLATNTQIADVLDRIGDLLEAKGDNPFRVNSYRRAASLVKDSDRSFARLAQEQGVVGLTKIRGIGDKLAGVIEEYVSTNKVSLLEDLEKEAPATPSKEQDSFPLADLPLTKEGSAAMKTKPGSPGSAGRTARTGRNSARRSSTDRKQDRSAARGDRKGVPPVSVILDVDKEYRKKSEEGSLKRIAPKQHNPEGEAWLPILSTNRGDWKFTAMYSNTAAAHQLGKTADWVVIYFKKKGEEERQCTVVTEHRGELKGKRVVRGREEESQRFYR